MAELQSLNPRHFKIIDLCLAGLSQKAIATELDMSPGSISIITKSPQFQHELALRRASLNNKIDNTIAASVTDASDVLKRHSVFAAQKLVQLVSSEDESIARMSASDILDRAGCPKVTKSSQSNVSTVVVLNAEDVQRLSETLSLISA